jgi:RNA polymerase subunit RPABC4/transcription elongation factor Spt4
MNAHIFDSHSIICPVCHHTTRIPASGLVMGLFTCPHCGSRLVVSWSGHYVRDPFTLQQIAVGQMLRRQSHPVARIIRDFVLAKRSAIAFLVASAVFLGLTWFGTGEPSSQRPSLRSLFRQVTEWVELTTSAP